MKSLLKMALAGTAGLVMFSSSAMAAWTFSSADLVIGFQAVGGTGSTTNLFFNLGDSYAFSQNGTLGTVGNINDDLTATYGANWFSRTDLYFGVFANRSNLSTTFEPGGPGVDAGRTVYLSTPTVAIGEANLRPQLGSSALGTGGSAYAGLRTNLGGFAETGFGDGVASLNQAAQPVEWNNSWSAWNPTPGAAFSVFGGGIQQSFGGGGSSAMVDIQRMTGGAPTTYVGSVIIGSDGSISAVPETSSSLLAAAAGAVACFRRRRSK